MAVRREGFGKLRLIPTFPEHPGAAGNDVKAKNTGAAQPGKLHDAGFGDEPGATGSVRSDRGLQSLAQSPDHFHQDASRSAAAGATRRGVAVPMNDSRNELAVEILAYHHHHSPLAPVPDGGKDFAMPESHDEVFPAPDRFVIILLSKNFPAHAAADQQHREITQPVRQKELDALPERKCARTCLSGEAGNPAAESGSCGSTSPRVFPS